ncbi:MAG: LamG-like jellyroll fold domain-containing protein, partial [Dolichospermum sp.]
TSKIYRNGALLSTNTSFSSNTSTGSTFFIGGILGTQSANFTLDDLKIYNVELTDAQAQAAYLAGSSAPNITSVSSTVNSSTQATVNYNLTAISGAATSIVRYSTNKNNLNNSVPGPVSFGATSANASLVISSLTANTKYYYAVSATNPFQTIVHGLDSFTTYASTTAPTISNVVGTGGFLNGTVAFAITPNFGNTTATLRYGTVKTSLTSSASAGTFNANSLNSSTNSDVGINSLLDTTKYYFRLEATNSAGTTTTALDSFTTRSVLRRGLVAYYGFSNNFNSHNGQHNLSSASATTPTFTTSGKYGQAASFNGSQALSNSTIAAAFPSSPAKANYTICFWENRNSVTTGFSTTFEMFASQFFRTRNSGGNNYEFGFASSPTNFNVERTGFGWAANLSVWQHIAISVGETSPSVFRMRLYSNGVLTNDLVVTGNDVLHKFNSLFVVGGGVTGSTNNLDNSKYFNGSIDEFYVYNRELNLDEINLVRNNGTDILPTKITSFTISSKENANLLNWTSENEINVLQFNIQHSTNGKDFETVGTVAANKQVNYSYSHYGFANTANHYYRLQVVDKDGAIVYSKVVRISTNSKADFTAELRNTIEKNTAILFLQSTSIKKVNVVITTPTGTTVSQLQAVVNTGGSSISVPIYSLSTGLYFVTILDEVGNKITHKLLKN